MKFTLIIFCFSSVAFFAQSKKELLYKQNLRIDSLTEALEIQKEEFKELLGYFFPGIEGFIIDELL